MNDNQAEKPSGPVSNLPKSVPLIEGSPILRANHRSDLIAMVDRINKVPTDSLYALIGFMYGHGMMLVRNWTIGGFIMNRSVNALARRYQGDRYTAWMTALNNMVNADYEQIKHATVGKAFLPQSPEALEKMKEKGMNQLIDMRSATVQHIIGGKDREERSSAGGFSQRELNAVNNVVTLLTAGEPLTIDVLRKKALGLAA